MSSITCGAPIRLCACAEPLADVTSWPDDMHVHPGCGVYHAGRVCTLGQPELPLDPR